MVADSKLPTKRGKFFPPALVARVRTCYVVKGMGPREIAEKVGLNEAQVSQLAWRYEWKAEREKRTARLEQSMVARAEDEHGAFLRSVSAQSEELAEDSLGVAREAIDRGLDATRELQQASQSAKNFVDIYFKANRLDANQGGTQINVGSLFCNLGSDTTGISPPGKRSEKVVTDVSAEPAQGSADGDTRLITGAK